MSNENFIRVSRQTPCPVCGKPDWCGVSSDGVWCVCMRVESGRRTKNGGWLHAAGAVTAGAPRPSPPPPCDRRLLDPAAYHAALRKTWDWHWADGLALSLGVDCEAVERLDPVYDPMHRAFAFPMRDADGRTVGVRLRNADGRKWAVRGSREGAFIPAGGFAGRELVVCEGPTDTAAALTLGLQAVGRPSCAGATEVIRGICVRMRATLVTIVADHDDLKRRPDGSAWRPGISGAADLGRALRRQYRVVVPPAKDIRQWVCEGATRETFDALADCAQRRLR
jgi:phage/plasmid primase-like uncharacterized protein